MKKIKEVFNEEVAIGLCPSFHKTIDNLPTVTVSIGDGKKYQSIELDEYQIEELINLLQKSKHMARSIGIGGQELKQ